MCAVCYGECVPDEEPQCVQSGCSGEVCSESAVYTPCIFLPWFECLEFTECGAYSEDGSCGFDLNDEFVACLEEKAECTTNDDCPEGFVCENDSWCDDDTSWCIGGGKCVPEQEPEGCQTDSDCAEYEYCEFVEVCPPCVDGDPACDMSCLAKGECKLKPGLCWDDSDCKPGEHCELLDCYEEGLDCGSDWPGQCAQSSTDCDDDSDCPVGTYCDLKLWEDGSVTGECKALDEDQCVRDEDCDPGFQCVFGPCPACFPCPCFGTCEKDGLEPGQCWTDDDCDKDEYCDIVKCDPATGEKCIGPYECKPKPFEGCKSDADCEPYEYCDFIVYDGEMDCCPPNAFCGPDVPPCEGGICRLLPGLCWEDADCGPFEYCVFMANCAPGENCIDWPGECVPDQSECVPVKPNSHGDCDMVLGVIFDGEKCIGESGCSCEPDCAFFFDTLDECEEACQLKKECLSDQDCGSGFYCQTETVCPDCADEEPPCLAPCWVHGVCEPIPDNYDCVGDKDCPEGSHCEKGPCPLCIDCPCFGECVPDKSDCETDADCLGYEYCDHSPWDEMPGCCVPLDSDGTGCPEGYPICPGVCKLKPGLCWYDWDCKPGEHCEGANICPPGAYCFAPDTPGECVPDQSECVAVEPNSHGACQMLLGVIFDGEKCVYESGCGCWPDCDNIFNTFEECEKACLETNPPPPTDCMSEQDCPAGAFCDYQGTMCIDCIPEDPDCVPGCFPMGYCEALPEGVCVKDADCADWMFCKLEYCPLCESCNCFGTCEYMPD